MNEEIMRQALDKAIGQLVERKIAEIRSELWDKGVNMSGEYQGVWVRYKDIEDVFDKHTRADTPVTAQN